MESNTTTTTTQSYKTGLKTLDKISSLPVVNTAIVNANDYYGKVKDKNFVFRTSFTLAELSLSAIAYAATPITNICKKPIEYADSCLSDTIGLIEDKYPIITKPVDQLTATAYSHVKGIYDKTLKPPIDTIYNVKDSSLKVVSGIKTYGTNKVNGVVQYGTNSLGSLRDYSYSTLAKSAGYGLRTIDALLEQKYAKMLTTPLLDLTERSINYLIPALPNGYENENDANNIDLIDETHTLRRIYDINKRVFQHTYQTTYNQIVKLNRQFNIIFEKLKQLKTYVDAAKDNAVSIGVSNINTLKAIVSQHVNLNECNSAKLLALSKSYYTSIVSEIQSMFNRYAEVLKGLPIVSRGTQLTQTTTELLSKIKTESLSELLKTTIDHLTTVHASIMSFVYQIFKSDQVSKNYSIVDQKKRY